MNWLAKLIWGAPHPYNGRDGYGYQPIKVDEDKPSPPPKAP